LSVTQTIPATTNLVATFQYSLPAATALSTNYRPTQPALARWADTDSLGALPRSAFDTTLSSSLLADLRRFSDDSRGTEALAVMAASVRHGKPLAVHLQHERGLVILSVFPREQLFECATDLCALQHGDLFRLRLVHVKPEVPLEPHEIRSDPGSPTRFSPLGPLLWMLAMHGSTSELLPEIAGPARYRLSAGLSLAGLPIDNKALTLLEKMRHRPVSLNELAGWTVMGRPQVRRLLNALYLQSGLMITRAFPENWVAR
jgi:hypothetical protein